jgi:UDPglucose 6-dehydrogenase
MVTLPPVSIVGLGKLGASMAAAIASRGGTVVGVDLDQSVVDAINAGRAPVAETNLESTLSSNVSRIRATPDVAQAVHQTAISFVIVPTPGDERGSLSIGQVAHAFEGIGHALAAKPTYHVVVLSSTVLPGTTRRDLLPILEHASGKAPGRDFGLCYSPEFIEHGTAIRDFLNPDFTLVGELDPRSGDYLEAYYAEIMANSPACMRMSLENAELAKIAIHSFVTMKTAFANMLAALCERIPGGDVDVVTSAVGADRRVGDRDLKGGLGYGGPCFPRDNVALGFFAQEVGEEPLLPRSSAEANARIPARLADRVSSLAPAGSTIAVLGLAYRPKSHVTNASQSVALARLLTERGHDVMAFDPLVRELPGSQGIRVVDNLDVCLQTADLIVVATPDPLFASLRSGSLVGRERPLTVVDCWRQARGLARVPGVTYVAAGHGSTE